MITRKLFQENVYIKDFQSTIYKITKDEIALDQTAFFPTGGGQSCDIGTIESFNVTNVYEQEGIIWHQVKGHNLTEGQSVSCQIDWTHRFDNMQRHCGEHILSGVFYKLYKAINKGFYMGDDYMTIDMYFPEDIDITDDIIKILENETNNIIWSNLCVITQRFKTKEEANQIKTRKTLVIDEDISIVSIGSISNDSFAVACCGTHPSTTGQVGLLKIYKVEKNKGMFRFYFDAGKRAFDDYNKKSDILDKISDNLSSGIDDLLVKFDALNNRNKTLLTELKDVKSTLKEFYLKDFKNNIDSSKELNIFTVENLSTKDINYIGAKLAKNIDGYIAIVDKTNLLSLIFSHNPNKSCKDLLHKLQSNFSVKGGGSDTFIQLKFENNKTIDEFINHI